MARAHFAEVAITPDGSFLPNARITTTLRNSAVKADVFATDVASSALPNPYFITDGIVSHWAEAGAYDVLIEDADSPPKVVAREIGWGAVPGVPGGMPGSMIADATVGNAQLTDGSVGTTKLADASVTNAKVAANAISTATINDGAVTSAKLATGAVSAPNYDSGWDFYNGSNGTRTYTHNLALGTTPPRKYDVFFSPDQGATYMYPVAENRGMGTSDLAGTTASNYHNPSMLSILNNTAELSVYSGIILFSVYNSSVGWRNYSTGYFRIRIWK